MSEYIYYIGLVLSIAFFIAAASLFIIKKIPTVIGYLLKIGKIKNRNVGTGEAMSIEAINATLKAQTGEQTSLLVEEEGMNQEDGTSLLASVEEYATALLDADNTAVLPGIEE